MKKRFAIAITCLHLMLFLCIDANALEAKLSQKAEQSFKANLLITDSHDSSEAPSNAKPSLTNATDSNEKADAVESVPECVIRPVMNDQQLNACGAHMKSQ